MNKNDILNCPFCGGEAKEESTKGQWDGYGLKTVYCQNCSASADRKDWIRRIKEKII